MAIHFLKCIGEPWEGKIKVNPNNWFGKTLKAKVGADVDTVGRPKNVIVSIFPDPNAVVPGGEVAATPAPVTAEATGVDKEEVPF
jgi:hypothetical protein